jgi:D-lactate dehydrogenase (cytochrome)
MNIALPSHPPLADDLVATLKSRFGSRFSQGESIRVQHGRDESAHEPAPPDAVFFAGSTDEVAEVVRLCHQYQVPIIPYGAGSSVEGHVLAIHGGISIDLSRMNRILAIHGEDLDVTVAAGVTRLQLNAALKGSGLFFPIDPGADASLGGMAATRASGTNAVRYGTMRDNVLAMTVVLADGRILKHRRPGAQILGRLRPDAAADRFRGHARHHHRTDRPPASDSRRPCRPPSAPSPTSPRRWTR